jgi:hypothetical protein
MNEAFGLEVTGSRSMPTATGAECTKSFSALCGPLQSLREITRPPAATHQLVNHIHSFIDSHNADAKPFVWTKSVVHQKRLKPCFAI